MNVNKNNIRPYLLDVLKWNHNIRLTVQEIKHPIAAWHHDLADTAAAGVKFQVADLPQLSAVLDIYHILAL